MRIPSHVRPRAYAGVELLLDVVYIAQSIVGLDLESTLICYCVAEATARPLIAAAQTEPDLLLLAAPPEDKRGSISRLAIADRTGLPRETVRRRVKALVEKGWLIEDDKGRLKAPPNLKDASLQRAADDTFAAVRRYDKRLRSLGAGGVSDAEK